MKQNELIISNLINSKWQGNSPCQTHRGLLQRAIILFAMLMLSVGSAWGQTIEDVTEKFTDIWGGSRVVNADESITYTSTGDWQGIAAYFGRDLSDYEKIVFEFASSTTVRTQILVQGNEFKVQDGPGITIQEASFEDRNVTNVSNIALQPSAATTLTIKRVYLVKKPVDTFLNTAKSGVAITSDSKEIPRTDDQAYVFYYDSENSTNNVKIATVSPKYARVFLTDASGTKLNSWDTGSDTDLLKVTYDGASTNAGLSAKNGVYVNVPGGIDLSKLIVTLKAGAGNFKNYKVVTLFSSDAMGATQEPQWDEEFTFSFTYPAVEPDHKLSYKLTDSEAEQSSYIVEIQNEIFGSSYLNVGVGSIAGHWYNRWYVLDDNGNQVSNVASSNSSVNGSWTFLHWYLNDDNTTYADWPHDRWQKDGNYIQGHSGQGGNSTENWFVERSLAKHVEVFAPSGTLSDYAGYKIVFEIDPNYTSGDPEIKLRYTFSIPPAFAYKGEISNKTNISQTVGSRTATNVTVDWTNSGNTTGAMTTTGIKYARFFVVDADGNAVDATANAHKLTVAGGTLCGNNKNGYYVYNNGSEITALPTVTLSSTDNETLRKHKVVCWLATDDTDKQMDGATMIVEPTITHEYLYTLKNPKNTSTESLSKTIFWKKKGMHADATEENVSTDWKSSWIDLNEGQYVKWTVVDGSGTEQNLVIGTTPQAGTWTVNAGGAYVSSGNAVILTGHTNMQANWSEWGNPMFFPPSDKSYGDLQACKIICTIAEENDAIALPVVRYEFSFNKVFEAENLETVERVNKVVEYNMSNRELKPQLFADLTALNAKLGENASGLSSGYARWFVTDASGNALADLTGWGFTSSTAYTAIGNHGWYRSPIGETIDATLDPTITLPEGYEYTNCRIVCAITTNTQGMNMSTTEPEEMEVLYVFRPYINNPSNYQFTHYRGTTGSEYITMGSDAVKSYNGGTTEILTTGIRQNVHTVEYDIYVKKGGIALLELPFQDAWNPGGGGESSLPGNPNEPREYFRWYDWNTDYAVTGASGALMPLHETAVNYSGTAMPDYALLKDRCKDNGQSRGLMAWFLDRDMYNRYGTTAGGDSYKSNYSVPPHKSNVAVTKFYRPNDDGWTQTDVACDVSRYRDGINTSTYELEHEPTLSVRYIWHIHPAEELAENIKNSLTVKTDGIHPMEDEGLISLGLNDGQAMASLHTELQDLDDYYFYNYDEASKTWGTEMYRAEDIVWRVYSKDRTSHQDFYASDILANGANATNHKSYSETEMEGDEVAKQLARDYPNGTWTRFFKFVIGDYDTDQDKSEKEYNFRRSINPSVYWLKEFGFDLKDGDRFPIIAYVANKDRSAMAPVLRADIWLQEGSYPILFDDLYATSVPEGKEELYKSRNYEWLKANYRHVGTVTFDPPTGDEPKYGYTEVNLTGGNFNAPTNPVDNMHALPLAHETGKYGFCYPDLRKQSQVFTYMGITPFHGEYGLFKSRGLEGVSCKIDENGSTYIGESPNDTYYCWYVNAPKVFYDRTYYEAQREKQGEKYGYFLYVDASDESRPITSIPFEANLCAGSSIVFTAAVANMTTYIYLGDNNKLSASPQILCRLYGVDTSTNEKELLESFTTGDFNSVTHRYDPVKEKDEWVKDHLVEWYQIYAKTELSAAAANKYQNFELEVVNYCDNTDGADYAIDDVRVYTSSAKLEAEVTNDECYTGDNTKLKLTINADDVLKVLGNPESTPGKNLFYRIFERYDDDTHAIREREALKGPNFYSSEPNGDVYGVIPFHYDSSDDYPSALPDGVTTGFYKVGGTLYFQMTEREFKLDASKNYFVSIFSVTEARPGNTVGEDAASAGWGSPYQGSECTVYSNPFTPKRMYLELKEGENISDGHISIDCNLISSNKTYTLVLNVPTSYGGREEISGLSYDFFVGTKDEYDDAGLKAALDAFRTSHSSGDYTIEPLPSDASEVIKTYVNNGKLLLKASNQFVREFNVSEQELTFIAEPVNSVVEVEGVTHSICSSMEFKFYVDHNGNTPLLKIGFEDVDYPDTYEKQVIRVGLEQLNKMKKNNYKLHIPLNDYHDKGKGTTSHLKFEGNLMLSATDDPTLIDEQGALTASASSKVFANVVDINGGSTDVRVDNDHMYLPLDLSDCDIDFHEGYSYEVAGQYYDVADEGKTIEGSTNKACRVDLFFVIKVVPKYVTWDSKVIVDPYYNANWNYDQNWLRSEKAELHKDKDGQNTDEYKNNDKIAEELTSHPGFVPMKFTYVTMPTGNHAPDLNNLESGKVIGTPQTGGSLINPNNTMLTETSPGNPLSHTFSSYSTPDIKYDMLVRYGTDAKGEGCKGHNKRSSRSGRTWEGSNPVTGGGLVFDCEKFDGNICKEIYFKPHSELIRQNRLTYEKAWVEKELVANKWYLMSSPLKDTFSGDMYVPAANGRQETEAFQPIRIANESGNLVTGYSRTQYPIYQRSWGQDATVYVKTGDTRGDYKANLNFTQAGLDGTNMKMVEWSHTYNDVNVLYNTVSGFSIRAHKKEQKDGSNKDVPALIRLPKEDAKYAYYDYADIPGTLKTVTKSTANIGRMLTDDDLADGKVSISVRNLQKVGDYYLVGNPFVCSIDMGKFFDINSGITNKKYWTYEASVPSGISATELTNDDLKVDGGKNRIRPLQAFFIKLEENDDVTMINFTKDMTTDGNYNPVSLAKENSGNDSSPSGARHTLRLQVASDGQPASSADVVMNSGASRDFITTEDVETLFDSNLSDVPMVYTVAGSQAVSVDVRPTFDIVPFGVTCLNNNMAVNVTFSGIGSLGISRIYVLDAATGTMKEVSEGGSYTIQSNDYGRYYLTTNGDATSLKQTDADSGIFVSVRNRDVTVTASEPIESVRIMDAAGQSVYAARPSATTISSSLSMGGIYVIEVQTAHQRKIMKVVVK